MPHFNLFLPFKEIGVIHQNVLIKVTRFEPGHSDVEIGLHHGSDVTLVYTEMERLDIVMMRKDTVNLGLHENVRDYSCQMICGNLLV